MISNHWAAAEVGTASALFLLVSVSATLCGSSPSSTSLQVPTTYLPLLCFLCSASASGLFTISSFSSLHFFCLVYRIFVEHLLCANH